MAGFSLVELLISLSIGVLMSGTILQAVLDDAHASAGLTRLLRERAFQQRTLDLIQDDLARTSRISRDPRLEQHACGLSGRLPVLHLTTAAGPITYSIGAAPSGIWRGQVLMRCGPAYGLDGEPSLGSQSQNRVILDGLAASPQPWAGCQLLLRGAAGTVDLAGSSRRSFSACLAPDSGLVAVRLQQAFVQGRKVTSVALSSVMDLAG
jgi:hypothetical protein